MEKLKDMKIKHDHTLTDIVKVVVFWLFLIMPILVWMPTALYYGFNEHADNGQPTYTTDGSIEYKYTTNELTSDEDFVVGNTYLYKVKLVSDTYDLISYTDFSDFTKCSNYQNEFTSIYNNIRFDTSNYINGYAFNFTCSEISTYNTYFQATINLGQASRVFSSTDNLSMLSTGASSNAPMLEYKGINPYTQNTTSLADFNFYSVRYLDINVIFTYQNHTIGSSISGYSNDFNVFINQGYITALPNEYNPIINADFNVTVNNDNSIVNAMSYAWQQTWQTPVLSWTGNQNFNFTIQAFTNIFGITEQSYITNYLTYLLTMTAIYVIFDIVLGVFKLITHLVNEK